MHRNLITALGLALAFSVGTFAQSAPASPPATPPSRTESKTDARAPRSAGYPFRGKLKSVDLTAKTLTLTGRDKDRVFHVVADTKFTKDGKPATLADGVGAEEVAGYARPGTDGRAEALTVRFGPAPRANAETRPAPPAAAPKDAAAAR